MTLSVNARSPSSCSAVVARSEQPTRSTSITSTKIARRPNVLVLEPDLGNRQIVILTAALR